MTPLDIMAEATRSAEQALAKLGLLALTNGVVRNDADRRTTEESPPSAVAVSPRSAEGMLFRLDQIKVRGAGRRPSTLVGREITVVTAWRVVAQDDDAVTAVLATGPTDGKNARRKKRRTV